jgi:hypothetical protein
MIAGSSARLASQPDQAGLASNKGSLAIPV